MRIPTDAFFVTMILADLAKTKAEDNPTLLNR